MYRRYISDITEEATSITFALVVRTADNAYTYGGGYPTLPLPMTEADLDAAVAKIVAEGDLAYPKKLTGADRKKMKPVANPMAHRVIENWARTRNLVDYPQLGQARGRR